MTPKRAHGGIPLVRFVPEHENLLRCLAEKQEKEFLNEFDIDDHLISESGYKKEEDFKDAMSCLNGFFHKYDWDGLFPALYTQGGKLCLSIGVKDAWGFYKARFGL